MNAANLPGRRVAMSPGVIAEFLAATALFRACERSVIDRVAPHLLAVEVPAGTAVVRAGSPDAEIGVLYAGRVLIRQVNAATGQAQVLDELRVGDSFGEVGATLQLAQPHEVWADETSTVLVVGKDVVGQLITKVPGFAHAVARKLATKIVQLQVSQMRAPAAAAAAAAPAPTAPAAPAADVMRFVRTAAFPCDDKTLSLVPGRLITQHRVLPLETRGRVVTVGMVDPFNVAAIAELRRVITSADVQVVAIAADDWSEAVLRFKIDPTARGPTRAAESIPPESIQYDITDSERDVSKAPVIGDEVVTLASRIIAAGIERGASDIHIEAEASAMRVRFRVAGNLVDWDQFVAASYAKGLVARFKILAGLDITERRLPQDGRIGLRAARRDVDLRVSTLPASRGEKLVLRVLEAASMMRPLDAILLEPRLLAALRAAINRPYGAVVVAGPTGSGKSSTLYAALNERRRTRPDTNVVMVEDPVEYRLQGATQVQVNASVDLTYPRVLRAFLRQDPDVIMVGEIRDRDTSMMALEAAMTGHLLFSSIHANDALGVLHRFENLGCHRSLVAQSLSMVLVQRLARRVCPRCVTNEVPPPVLLDSLAARGLVERGAAVALPRGAGCAECQQTGYQGRVAVLECLELLDPVRDVIMAGANTPEIEQVAVEVGAYTPFRTYASYLMSRNLLSPAEALVTVA
ncbi:MAG: Flp pilus assembly complex ATPase component TadA [Kofleriaceae bacterium]|nr:Flp pilus assembly complex ATPase component TadA [Kofleriaceae bacterium]